MKIEIKKISPCKRELAVEVPAELAESEYRQVVEQYRKLVVVSGFRKGKVPASVIKARYAKEIETEFYGKMIPGLLKKAMEEQKVSPIAEPSINEIHFNPGEPLKFSAHFEVKPEMTVTGYKGVEVKKPEVTEIKDEDVDRVIQQFQDAKAAFNPVTDRSLRKGDFAEVNLWGTFTSGRKKNFFRDSVLLEVGGEGNPPGFNTHVAGMNPGQELEFLAMHPQDDPNPAFSGEEVKYRVKLLEIKMKTLPDLDDEFARDVAGCDTVADLRKKIRGDLEKMEERKARQTLREEIITAIREKNPVEPPTVYVEKEIDARIQMVVKNVLDQGMDPAKLEIDWGEMRNRFRPDAEKSASNALILEVIAGLEKIEVTDQEILDEIAAYTEGTDKSPEETRAVLEKEGRLESVRNQLLTRKTIDFLAENAKITS
jgi:trigger factor